MCLFPTALTAACCMTMFGTRHAQRSWTAEDSKPLCLRRRRHRPLSYTTPNLSSIRPAEYHLPVLWPNSLSHSVAAMSG